MLAQLGLRAANAAGSAQAAAAPVALSALEAATTSQQQPTWGARSFAAGSLPFDPSVFLRVVLNRRSPYLMLPLS